MHKLKHTKNLCYGLRSKSRNALTCSFTTKDKDGRHERRPHSMEVLCK